jgi:hypothetical protein
MQDANFGELRKGEVRRILIPRTPVNKGKRKGRALEGPALRCPSINVSQQA